MGARLLMQLGERALGILLFLIREVRRYFLQELPPGFLAPEQSHSERLFQFKSRFKGEIPSAILIRLPQALCHFHLNCSKTSRCIIIFQISYPFTIVICDFH